MISLKEYQAKQILNEGGICIPKGVTVLKSAKTSFKLGWSGPAVIKAQVDFGSRKKKGLVRFAKDLKSISKEINSVFSRVSRYGFYDTVLVEENIMHSKEYYLSIVSDPLTRGPLVVFSAKGGVEVETLLTRNTRAIHKKPISILDGLGEIHEFAQFFKRAGVAPTEHIGKLVELLSKLYGIYRKYHCSFVEINPLVFLNGECVALDAKIELDEDAGALLNEKGQGLLESSEHEKFSPEEALAAEIDKGDYRGSCHFVQTDMALAKKVYKNRLKSFVGFNGVGTGVSLTAMDELVRRGFYPRNFCDTSGNPPASKLYRVTKIILRQKGIGGYFFISCMSSQQLDNTARGIIKAFKEIYAKKNGNPDIPCLLVFRGAWDEKAKDLFKEHGIVESEKLAILGREASETTAVETFERLYEAAKKRS